MNIKTTVTVNLSIADTEALITEVLLKQMPNHTIKSITFKVADLSNDRYDRYSHHGFTGVDVVMEPKGT